MRLVLEGVADCHGTTGRYRSGKRVLLFGKRRPGWLHIELGREAVNVRWRRQVMGGVA